MKRLAIVALVLVVGYPCLVFGVPDLENTPKDGNFLLRACGEKRDSSKPVETQLVVFGLNMWCTGYLQGLLDMNAIYSGVFMEGKAGLFCLPKAGVSTDQASRIVVKYLEDNPKFLHESMRQLVIMSFHDAFPCGGDK